MRCLLAWCLLLIASSSAHARPVHKQAIAEHLGSFLPKKLNDCVLCHLPDRPDVKVEGTEKPHNVFGARLAKLKKELQKDGKKTDIVSRFEMIADEDADGDGASNILELLSGHAPGDAKDTPTKDQLAASRQKLLLWSAAKKEYRWRPFAEVQRPAVPAVKNQAWVRNPIDAFVAREHEKQGLDSRPEAPRHVLIRRLTLDLIGLPPTPEEIETFVNDKADDAYEKVVDRLLASPHYGERWGRHWMDVWRYSDWAGYGAEVRDSQPHIWRWRDWIVDSLNEDKPYDRMVQEMLAGDELAPNDPKTLRATGFLVRNWYKFNRDVWLDRTIEHTGKAFLGLTLNCARCHDHFFDPIAQKEYYQFRAFFEPHDIRMDKVAPHLDTAKEGLVRVFDARPDAKTYLYIRGEDKDPDKKNPLDPAFLSILGGGSFVAEPVKIPKEAQQPDRQPWVIDALLKEKQAAVAKAKAACEKQPGDALAELDLQLAEAHLAALHAVLETEPLAVDPKDVVWEKAAKSANQAQVQVRLLQARKDLAAAEKALTQTKEAQLPAAQKKRDVAAAALKVAEAQSSKPATTDYVKRPVTTYPAVSTGRRLALAKWITAPDNPLTARVAVNHIWLRHFGKPLAPNAFDFGSNSQAPSHPALLDWLAAELMSPSPLGEEGLGVRGKSASWSMKRLHRLIVTSSAYRMDSTPAAVSLEKDPENRWLWRMNTRRMEAEIIRDSVLAAAGRLDKTLGGPDIDQNLGLKTNRRSLYYRYAPEKMMEFLTLFDSANVNECYQRTESVVPQQALALANSALTLDQSRLLARALVKKLGDKATPADFVKAGYRHVLGRPPSAQELKLCEEFLEAQAKLLADPKKLTPIQGGVAPTVAPATEPGLRARESLIHVLFNHHEFVTIR